MKIFFQIEKRNDIDIFRVKLENSFGCWQNTVWRMGVTGNTVIITLARWISYLVLLQMKSINKMYFCLRELYYEENFIGLLFPCNPDQCHLYFNICYIHLDPVQQIKQAE